MFPVLKFLKGLKATYDSIFNKDENTLYITTDENVMYLGDKELCALPDFILTEKYTGVDFFDIDDNQYHKIYKQMIQLPTNAFSTTATNNYNHNIPNVDKIWIYRAFSFNPSTNNTLPLPSSTVSNVASNDIGIRIYVGRQQITTTTNVARGNYTYNRVVLKYTCTDR